MLEFFSKLEISINKNCNILKHNLFKMIFIHGILLFKDPKEQIFIKDFITDKYFFPFSIHLNLQTLYLIIKMEGFKSILKFV